MQRPNKYMRSTRDQPVGARSGARHASRIIGLAILFAAALLVAVGFMTA